MATVLPPLRLRNIGKGNRTQKARRDLLTPVPKQRAQYDPLIPYTEKNTRKGIYSKRLYTPSTKAEKELTTARKSITNLTYAPDSRYRMSSVLGPIYANISAKAVEPGNMLGLINLNTRLSPIGKEYLRNRVRHEYTDENLSKRSSPRKRTSRKRQSRRTRVY
jgi:hypothetical protein